MGDSLVSHLVKLHKFPDTPTEYRVVEYPLYSDTNWVGEISASADRPYAFLHLFAETTTPRLVLPRLMLRVHMHLDPSASVSLDATDSERYHGGSEKDEMAALLSLFLGGRLQAGDCTRVFGRDPRKHGAPQTDNSVTPSVPSIATGPIVRSALEKKETHTATQSLDRYQQLSAKNATAFVKAARLYQKSLWLSESTPEQSWLLMTSAIETLAQTEPQMSSSEALKKSKPELVEAFEKASRQDLLKQVEEAFGRTLKSAEKFTKFLLKRLPSEPSRRPRAGTISWKPEAFEEAFRKIYDWRSRALHDGTPSPAPMCASPFPYKEEDGSTLPSERPFGIAQGGREAVWHHDDTPMLLHVFEYIVRQAMLTWFNEASQSESERGAD